MAASTNQYQHPLPSAPQQTHFQHSTNQDQAPAGFQYHQPPQQDNDPRAKPRTFSVGSHKSHKSQGSSGSKNLYETSAEKSSRRLTSKADPTLAMNEAEPSAIAAMRSETVGTPLRDIQHKDLYGNPIADPDRSNPTRNRWERPLDTIRSFEAAIDGGYSRKLLYRSETDSVANWNRRSSMMASSSFNPRAQRDSFYGSRPMSLRADHSQYGFSTPGLTTARNSGFFDGQGAYGYSQQPQGRQHPRDRQRLHPDQQYQYQQPVYPMPHKDRSYETVTSAAASGNSDPAGYQTDPTSSDNSSIRRASPAKHPEPVNDYGIGFSQAQSYHPQNFAFEAQATSSAPRNHALPAPPPHAAQQQQYQAPPPVPSKNVPAVLRREPSKQSQQDGSGKRKSWLSRRFSRNA